MTLITMRKLNFKLFSESNLLLPLPLKLQDQNFTITILPLFNFSFFLASARFPSLFRFKELAKESYESWDFLESFQIKMFIKFFDIFLRNRKIFRQIYNTMNRRILSGWGEIFPVN